MAFRFSIGQSWLAKKTKFGLAGLPAIFLALGTKLGFAGLLITFLIFWNTVGFAGLPVIFLALRTKLGLVELLEIDLMTISRISSCGSQLAISFPVYWFLVKTFCLNLLS